MKYLIKSMTLALSCLMVFSVQALSPECQSVADYAVKTYEQAMLDSLTKLVSFKTVATEGMTPDNDPEFIGFKAELKQLALELDLSYSDHGYVLLIGLGEHDDKLGVITHGDVQPANPKLWSQDPFILDT